MLQVLAFLDLQMSEGNWLALHQVLGCHLEQWHEHFPITGPLTGQTRLPPGTTGPYKRDHA